MADYIYSPVNFEQDKALLNYVDTLQVKEHYIKIHIFNPHTGEDIGDIEGVVTQGSISVNGNSSIRRTGSLTLIAPDEKIFGLQFDGKTIHKVTDLKNLIAINKRARIYVGYSNTGYQYADYDMFWFPLGTFVLQNPSVTHSNSGVQIQVKLSDLMTLLNGTEGGDLQMAIVHSPIYSVTATGEEEESAVQFKTLVETLVTDMGQIPSAQVQVEIPTEISDQIYRWVGEEKLYATTEKDTDDKTRYIFSIEKPNGSVYSEYEMQDPIGVKVESFTYPEKLSSNPGESIVSVLDKIKKTLGNYEYFFDIDGIFHFREIDNGLNDGEMPDDLTAAINAKYFADYTGDQKPAVDYEFENGQLISSYSNTPKFDMVKNNLVAWGKNNNTKLGIRYHLLIDKKPKIVDDEGNPLVFYCQQYIDDFGVQRIWTASTTEEVGTAIPVENWRHWMYLNAIATGAKTVLDKELVEELPKVMNIINGTYKYDANPVALDYWIDMIDIDELEGLNDNTLITNMAIEEIGDRSKTYNDDKVNCIFAPSIKYTRLFYSEEEKDDYDGEYEAYAIVPEALQQSFGKGIAHNSAFDYMRSLLHEHISANNTISLQTMPIYYLEPNMRVSVDNDEADIHGEYIISSLTMPLTVNGMMTIQAAKAAERI